MVSAWPRFASGSRSFNGGSVPCGYGLLRRSAGVMPPSALAFIVVVRTASIAPPFVPAIRRGCQKTPYPPRSTPLSLILYAKPKRGPTLLQSVLCWFGSLPAPTHFTTPFRFGRPALAPIGL